MSLNLHAVFYRASDDDCFHQQIAATNQDRVPLDEVKDTIRAALRQGIPLWLTARADLAIEAKQTPRFRTQGSWRYGTCNRPEQLPPQEMDLDDGIYLPLSMWKDSEVPQRYGAAVFFQMIEDIIRPVCKQKGWHMRSKATCVRVSIPGQACHVDFPLYVAPDEQFKKIVESRAIANVKAGITVDASNRKQWESLTRIALAQRDGSWRYSDPEAVRVWFEKCVEVFGPQLRRIARYLKTWRDTRWAEGGPSSLLLMACAVNVLQSRVPDPKRDDETLLNIAEQLPALLQTAVYIPPTDDDLNRLSEQDRRTAAQYASEMFTDLRRCLRQYGKGMEAEALFSLSPHFGRRFPTIPSAVIVDAPHVVRSIPAIAVPQPKAYPSTSG